MKNRPQQQIKQTNHKEHYETKQKRIFQQSNHYRCDYAHVRCQLIAYGTVRTRKNWLARFVYDVNHSVSGKRPATFVVSFNGAATFVPVNTS